MCNENSISFMEIKSNYQTIFSDIVMKKNVCIEIELLSI